MSPSSKTQARASQEFVPIREIRDGVVVLKDNGLRAVLLASSLNFALKSADEQQAITLQFQNFLNSLEFPVQIAVQSRNLDIRPYIALLEERYAEQTTELLKIQTREYIEFIRGFVENVNIMSKRFFVVVSFAPSVIASAGGVRGLLGLGKKDDLRVSAKQAEGFDEGRSQLEQRVSVVSQGLSGAGIRLARLGTEELVELYYKTFNPGELGKPIVPGAASAR